MIPNKRERSLLTNSNEPQLISITSRGCNSYQKTAPRAVTARLPPLPHVALVTRATHALYTVPTLYLHYVTTHQPFLSEYLWLRVQTNAVHKYLYLPMLKIYLLLLIIFFALTPHNRP